MESGTAAQVGLVVVGFMLVFVEPAARPEDFVVRGPAGSLFGYSLAFRAEGTVDRLLIGAPKDAGFRLGSRNLTESGSVFQCAVETAASQGEDDGGGDRVLARGCYRMEFDRTGNNVDGGLPVEDKSGQWFGASLASAGPSGVIACAPRYVFFSADQRRRDPVGTCWVARPLDGVGVASPGGVSESSPCRTDRWGFQGEGFCQYGMAVHAAGDTFLVGAVGTDYWQGQVYSRPGSGGGVETPHWSHWNASNDNQYLGYSVTAGRFRLGGEGGEFEVAAGAPRAAGLRGRVHLMSSSSSTSPTPRVLYTFTGEQVGSYFGHSLLAADVDGDGTDDLVVGAPLFTEAGGDADGEDEAGFEQGRVYVIIRSKKGLFKSWRILYSPASAGSRSRFGFALASPGDADGDGAADLVVSAPGAGGAGAVFVYYSTAPSPTEISPAQGRRGLAFGFSLATTTDAGANLTAFLLASGDPLAHSAHLFLVKRQE